MSDENTLCSIATGVCVKPPVQNTIVRNDAVVNPQSVALSKAVDRLNEALHFVPGVASHLHWTLPYLGDKDSEIEFFEQNGTQVTNLLGILNGILSYNDDGYTYRIAFSTEDNRYFTQVTEVYEGP